ncbi:MAG: hypothetical protein WAV31_00715 [Candidatus Moraniibacteriota bacterium]
MSEKLTQNILVTICYYDVLDYPLTVFEIWKYLITKDHEIMDEKNTLLDVVSCLEMGELKKKVESYNGYYFLAGRKNLVSQRIERNKIAEKKIKLVRRAVWLLRAVPFVRMIAVTGRIAMKNTERKSDLDLLIVLKKKHIFTGRLLVTIVTHLLGMRRYGQKITNRICLNYFVTTNSLEIDMQDLFASSEYSFIVPIFGFEYFRMFQKANFWIKNYHENYTFDQIENLKIIKDSYFSRQIRKIGESIFGFEFIESKLKSWQVSRVVADPRTKKAGSLIVADDNSLVFLPDPQGPRIFDEFQKRLERIK